jgi:hypothetical protein
VGGVAGLDVVVVDTTVDDVVLVLDDVVWPGVETLGPPPPHAANSSPPAATTANAAEREEIW